MFTTSKASSPSQRSSLRARFPGSLALLLCAFGLTCFASGCTAPTEEVMVNGKPRRVKKSVAAQFEWAVQSYEAGDYEEAVRRFERLRQEGAEVPDYDLIAYYLGMGRYRLGSPEAAARELESFLRAQPGRQESQDARLSLLLAYEKLARWKQSATLAAETDKLTLFQYNRALLKLLWARSLREQGELQGAQAVLDDSAAYLDKVGKEESRAIPFYANQDQDLWGRYHFTAVLLKTSACATFGPSVVKKKKLYGPWLEAETDCFRGALTTASEELFARESPWAAEAEEALRAGVESFGKKILAELSREARALERHAALQKTAREQLYRLLGSVDDTLKNFKNRGIKSGSLETLRKQLDRLLVTISGAS